MKHLLRTAQRHVGEGLIGIGAIHIAYGAAGYGRALLRAMRRGWPDFLTAPVPVEDLHATWFLVPGPCLVMVGVLTRAKVRDGGTVPPAIGWGLIATSVMAVLVEPQNGIYAVLAAGVLIVTMPRRQEGAPIALARYSDGRND